MTIRWRVPLGCWLALTISAWAFPAGAATGGLDRAQRLDSLDREIGRRVAAYVKGLKPTSQPGPRDLAGAALYVLATGAGAPAQAESLLTVVFAAQDTDPASAGYGSFAWQIGHPEIKDANSVDFTMLTTAAAFSAYADRLAPAFRAAARPHLIAAGAALTRHKVSIDYTNIFLMNGVALVMLGQALQDAALRETGAARLRAWSDTSAIRWGEFLSPTYSAVQLNCLGMGYRFIADADLKARLRRGLDRLWVDLAADFFAPASVLAGPHSRDYDFLFGNDFISFYFFLEGMADRLAGAGISDVAALAMAVHGSDYLPPRGLVEAALGSGERVARGRFGPGPGQDRYAYVTGAFALGSMSAWYGPQDKPIAARFATAKPDFPNVAVWVDTLDAPYGKSKLPDRSGHLKPVHAKCRLAVSQEKGDALALIDAAAGLNGDRLGSLATDVILPLAPDTAYAGGAPIDFRNGGQPLQRKLEVGAVLGFREGDALFGIRVFRADGCAGQAPALVLRNDGMAWGAARLAIYHYQGDSAALRETRVRAGLRIRAAMARSGYGLAAFLSDLAREDIRDSLDAAGNWSAVASRSGLQLDAVLGPKGPLSRRANGRDVAPTQGLSVEGAGWGPFQAVLPIAAPRGPRRPGPAARAPWRTGRWDISGRRHERPGPAWAPALFHLGDGLPPGP